MRRLFGAIAERVGQAGAPEYVFMTGLAAAVTAYAAFIAFRNFKRARLIEDIPTAKARSAHQGYVELHGRAELMKGEPIRAPLSGRECCWWAYTIEQASGDEGWRTVEKDASHSLFLLRDETGACIVDPEDADVVHSRRRRWRGSKYRYTERYLFPGDRLYAIGYFRTHKGIDEWNTEEEMRILLADWKKDQPALLERFDTNKDGRIDLDEWEAARSAAREEVTRERTKLAADPGVHVLGVPPDGRPFLLAPVDELNFTKRLRRRALGAAVAGVAAFAALLFFLGARFGP
jgi:hypothetical protein